MSFNLEKLNRSISMNCPVCTSTQFKVDESQNGDHQIIECVSCGKQLSKSELLKENSENIDVNLKEIEKIAVKEIQKEFSKSFKNLSLKLKL